MKDSFILLACCERFFHATLCKPAVRRLDHTADAGRGRIRIISMNNDLMPDTLQILYTKGGTPYAKTRVLLPHDPPVIDYVALCMMKELLDDIRIGEEEAAASGVLVVDPR